MTNATLGSAEGRASPDGLAPRLVPKAFVHDRAGFGSSRLYELIARGLFPMPVKLGRSSRWVLAEVDAWISARIAGASDEHIQVLVAQMHELRRSQMPVVGGRGAVG